MLKKFLVGTVVALALGVFLTASASYDFGSTTLRVGSKGDYVKTLQTLVGTTADGSFGPMTAAKVKVWQAANGLVADGVFGPMSMAKANLGLGGTTGTTLPAGCQAGWLVNPMTGASCTATTPSTLEGGAGEIIISKTSTDVESEVAEGNSEKVLGFKVEADGSDVSVSNAKIIMKEASDDTKSYRLTDYVDSVEIYKGSTKIGSVDASDFSKSSTEYSKTISLSNAVVKDGNKDTFYVVVKALSNLDSSDLNKIWDVTLDSVRFQDATGVIMSYTTVQPTEDFSFTNLASSSDVKITISKATSSPALGNVEVSDSKSTSDIKLLDFKLKAGGSDMSFDQVMIKLTAVGATTSQMIDELVLKQGSDEIASTDIVGVSGATTTFDLDDTYTIDADATDTFSVYAKIKEVDGVLFTNGDSLKAELLTTGIEVEDQNGDVVTDEVGGATGTVQSFYATGALVTYVGQSFTPAITGTSSADGTISIKFKVVAFGDNDVTISDTQTYHASAGDNVLYYTLTGGTQSGSAVVSSTDITADSNIFTVTAGDDATFTLAIKYTPTSGFVKVALTSVDGTTVSNVETASN